jgi:HPt (histidine-containing phosphotransfer) domain-containing protein
MTALPPEVMASLQEEYLESFDTLLNDLKVALTKEDYGTLEKHFHRFAGSGSTYGLPEITEVSRAIETFLNKNKNPPQNTLRDSLDLFERVIEAYRKRSSQPSRLKKDVLKKIA